MKTVAALAVGDSEIPSLRNNLAMKRFWDKVEKNDSCWNWIAGSRGNGYGCIKYKGINYDAHRFVWFLTYGKLPKKWILHKCNNRKCVKIEHLYEGTPKENVRDTIIAGTRYDIGSLYRGKPYTKHGKITMYNVYKCRCDKCKLAKKIQNAKRGVSIDKRLSQLSAK